MMDVEVDNLSVVLLSILAGLLVYLRFFSRPEPLVHPLLLGKQSEVSKVRQQGETGVYRSWATGQDTPVRTCALRRLQLPTMTLFLWRLMGRSAQLSTG